MLGTDIAYSLLEPVIVRAGRLTQHLYATQAHYADDDVARRDIANQFLIEENDALKKQLQLHQDASDTGVLAAVILREVSSFNKSIWIDKGEQAGIADNDAVMANGYVVGKVVETHKTSAEVQLIIDPAFKTTVKTKSGAHGILEMQKGSLIVDLLPEHGKSGALFYTDGLDSTFENGLPIGELSAEFGNASDVFGKYYARLPFNPHDIDFVHVSARAKEKNL